LSKLVKMSALVAVAAVSCGFNDAEFEYRLNTYRGEPVPAAIARLGRPVQTGYTDGQRIYWWGRTFPTGGAFVCKIWGAARHHIIVNWGYQDCAY